MALTRAPRVVSTLVGGLGNQLFQYAAGRALALCRGVPLQLDVGWLAPYVTRHAYELGAYGLDVELITDYRRRRLSRARELVGLAPPVFRHTAFPFEPKVIDLPGRVRLVGYWQSEKYFSDHADTIRSDLKLPYPLDDANAATAAAMAASTAACLSVRRGDYATDARINRYHGVLPLEYYRAGVQVITERAPDARFFVFSDDIAWCRTNLILDAPAKFVDHEQNRPADDLRLMAMCRYHVIANSTFSWWGAWLARHEDKLVVAPKQWAQAEDVGPDLVPPGWIRL